MGTYNIINVFPIIQRDELESGEHGPHEVIEVRKTEIRIITGPETSKTIRTVSERHIS